jgi:catechol 2,3-dioxygenase-like lactoylglutathione lyase family enzyme
MKAAVSHVGLCVTDLARSLRFYCDGLGFVPGSRYAVGSDFARTLEVAGPVDLVSQFVAKNGFQIELLCYATPRPHGSPSRSRGALGFTHLSVLVDDVDAAAKHLVECGGTLLPDTRTSASVPGGTAGEFVFVADPDGVRVELMQALAGG